MHCSSLSPADLPTSRRHVIEHDRIDELNILQATLTAMRDSIHELHAKGAANYALIDGNRLPKELKVPADAIVKGDAKCYCIAAASIIAKVTRDRIMRAADEKYPQYGFAEHKGACMECMVFYIEVITWALTLLERMVAIGELVGAEGARTPSTL